MQILTHTVIYMSNIRGFYHPQLFSLPTHSSGSLAVAAASPSVWRVRGGNRQIPEQLLCKARATRLHRHVLEIAAVQGEEDTVTAFEVRIFAVI